MKKAIRSIVALLIILIPMVVNGYAVLYTIYIEHITPMIYIGFIYMMLLLIVFTILSCKFEEWFDSKYNVI